MRIRGGCKYRSGRSRTIPGLSGWLDLHLSRNSSITVLPTCLLRSRSLLLREASVASGLVKKYGKGV